MKSFMTVKRRIRLNVKKRRKLVFKIERITHILLSHAYEFILIFNVCHNNFNVNFFFNVTTKCLTLHYNRQQNIYNHIFTNKIIATVAE